MLCIYIYFLGMGRLVHLPKIDESMRKGIAFTDFLRIEGIIAKTFFPQKFVQSIKQCFTIFNSNFYLGCSLSHEYLYYFTEIKNRVTTI